jgi:histidinol-phosphate phosphatase family protein
MSRPACFLDRDGTLTEERGYARTTEDVVLLPGAAPAVRLLNERRVAAVVITNQSGVGRGYFTLEDLRAQHEKLRSLLAGEGAVLDGIYACPHHPDDHCACRKPRTLLLERAARDLDLDLGRSWAIGDRAEDVSLGVEGAAGGVLVRTGYGDEAVTAGRAGALIGAAVFPDVLAAVTHLLGSVWVERESGEGR